MKGRKEQIDGFYKEYAKGYVNGSIPEESLRGRRADHNQSLKEIPGILEDRVEDLKEWLTDIDKHPESDCKSLFEMLDYYLNEGWFLKNPYQTIEELKILLKDIMLGEEFENTEPYFILNVTIKGVAKRGVELTRKVIAIEKLLSEIESNTFNERRELSNNEKISLWIEKNIPNSWNKDDYKKAFEVVANHPQPKKVTIQSLIEDIEEEYPNLNIKSKSLEKRIPIFIHSLPL